MVVSKRGLNFQEFQHAIFSFFGMEYLPPLQREQREWSHAFFGQQIPVAAKMNGLNFLLLPFRLLRDDQFSAGMPCRSISADR